MKWKKALLGKIFGERKVLSDSKLCFPGLRMCVEHLETILGNWIFGEFGHFLTVGILLETVYRQKR